MYDNRQALEAGSIISYKGIEIRITGVLGRGGNALVYTAEYDDSLVEGGVHKCIVKELFPYHRNDGIYRGDDGKIICQTGAEAVFRIHKQSFLHGNAVHLCVLKNSSDSVGTNFDSFEENGTMYTVLGLNSIVTLRHRAGSFRSVSEILKIIIRLLKAVEVFHQNKLLHLDISPDNIILSQSNGEERVLLIDFNSSCGVDTDELREGYISINPQYSAPELKLGRFKEISEASDIFSICAVFVYLISGENFVYALTRPDTLAKSKLLREIPKSAADCLLRILTKGLRSRPQLRFQTAAEMLEACYELQNRIDNIGVTHACLWEASRLMCDCTERELLDNNISVNGRVISSKQLFLLGNTVMTGEGGIGKTTLYKQLWYSGTRVYRASEPVSFFVPLYKYDGGTDFIKRYIVSKIKFGGGISTVSDALQRLTILMNGDKPFLYIMLDGFNEISADGTDIIREIDELGKMRGVTVSISERTDTLEYLKEFSRVSLLPLEKEQVRKYLNIHAVAYPEDEQLIRLLTNPLMLMLFTKTEAVFQKSGDFHRAAMTSSEIIHGYLEGLLEAHKQASPEDRKGQLRLSYVLKFLFPALCTEFKKNTVLDFKKIRAVCMADYRRLKSKAFSHEFKDFSGRTDEILGGARNADEWMNIALNKILLLDTALIICENGVYYPFHFNFSECLTEAHKQNMKRLRKAALGIRVPVTAAVTAICLCTGTVIYYYFPGTHPIGAKEIKNNYEIMTMAVCSADNVLQMTVNEKDLIEQLEQTDNEKGLEVLYSIAQKLDTLGDAEVSIDRLSEKAYRGLNTERVEKILAMSAEHRAFQKDMFIRLEYALSPSSIYTKADIEKELNYYKEYLSDYEKLMGYEACLLTRTINDKGGGVIKEAMTGSGNMVRSFNNALEIKTEDLENSINSLELNLKALKAKLGLIRGESL